MWSPAPEKGDPGIVTGWGSEGLVFRSEENCLGGSELKMSKQSIPSAKVANSI